MLGLLVATSAAFVLPPDGRVALPPASPFRLAAHTSCVRMASEEPAYTKGISSVLGGGKSSDEIEVTAAANIGSALAFAAVLGGLAYGTLNPDAVESIAKSQYKCDPNKIVNGKRVECKQTASAPVSPSPFPA